MASPETSFWKKEIGFGRKAKEQAPAASQPESRQPPAVLTPASEAEATPAPEPEPAAPKAEAAKSSIWKKDIALGRKPKTKTQAPASAAPAPELPAAPASAPQSAAPKSPFWRKEIGVGRK